MKMLNYIKKSIFLCFSVIIVIISFCGFAFAADDVFEKEISAFPESYKPYLRTLHEAHPEWKFEAFITGLDWQDAVDNQYGTKSTINNSSDASDIYKSRAKGHYNYDGGYYYNADYGYAVADKLAIEYYMDPRNFLNDYGIFMFEQLSFSEDYTVSSVETVLKGTFMYNTVISYYDASGNKITTNKKYSQVIHEAGKTYNVNPCYLASKIRIEVGEGTSGSTSGKHRTYPGIYNFYNIGANDGSDPVSNGLKYASTGSTYMRPWDSPYKSIMGGAQFIANTYIAKGQDTSYLQRFNVNKNASFDIYTHQYMTNVAATHSQVYQTYKSYEGAGLVDYPWIFMIPVYKNMPSDTSYNQTARVVDSLVQYGQISASSCNVRTGPSTNNSKKTDSSGKNISLTSGTKVTILDKVVTDSKYCGYILQYPVWYKISFTYNSATYNGYVPCTFVKHTTYTDVKVGEYNVSYLKTDPDVDMKLVSRNINIAQIVDNDTIKFLKEGEVEIIAYNSSMVFDRILFKVGSSSSAVTGMSVKSDNSSITVSVNSNSSAAKYGFYLADDDGKLIKQTEQSQNSYTFSSLEKSKNYKVYARYVFQSGSKYGATSAMNISTKAEEKPAAPTGVKLSNITNSSYRISWNAVDTATGYRVYRYDLDKGAYVTIGNTTQTYMDFKELSPGYRCGYRVKAYKKGSDSYLYSENSSLLWTATKPSGVINLSIGSFTSSDCELLWNASEGATHYYIYRVSDEGKYTKVGTSTTNKYTVKSLKEFTEYTFAVSAVTKCSTCITESAKSASVSVKTSFSPVTNLKVKEEAYDSIKLIWDAADSAARYEVFVFEGNSSSYSFKLETNTNSITVSGLEEFSDYRFSVKSIRIIENRVYASDFSETISAETVLPGVGGFTSDNVTGSSYRLKWTKNQYATSYNVYKKNGSSYVKIASVKNNYYDASSLNSSTVDYYKVSAVRTVGSTVYESALSSEITAATLPDKVKNFTATVGSSTAVVKWDKVKNASCYNLYRYNSTNKAYELIKTVTDSTYTVKGLTIGQSYKLRIRAYIKTSTGTQKGDSSYITFIAKPAKVTDVYTSSVTTDSYYLRWAEAKGANCYYVYKYDSSTKTYKAIAKTTKLYYKVTNLTPGRTEAYKVLSAITKNSKLYVKGNFSAVYKFATKPDKVSGVKVSSVTNNTVTLKWDKLTYYSKYEIVRYDTSTKKYTLVGTATTNSITLKNLKSSTNYYYKVRAVRTLNDTSYNGAYSDLVKAKTK